MDQLLENPHRTDMHDAEVLSGVEQLSLIGIRPAQIANRVTIKRGDVDAALVVEHSEGARAQMASEQQTLEEAAMTGCLGRALLRSKRRDLQLTRF